MLKDLVRQARTHRRFVQGDPLPMPVLLDLVDTARCVSSGANLQPLRYRIVGHGECGKVFPHLKWAAALKDWGGPAEGEKPTAYIIILVEGGRTPAIDVGIAAQTIQLAATEAGYAACMMASVDRPALAQSLALPATMEVQLVMALGRPGETIVLEEMPTGGNCNYWRTPDGVHHVPKRSLEDVLVK